MDAQVHIPPETGMYINIFNYLYFHNIILVTFMLNYRDETIFIFSLTGLMCVLVILGWIQFGGVLACSRPITVYLHCMWSWENAIAAGARGWMVLGRSVQGHSLSHKVIGQFKLASHSSTD